MGTLTGGSPNGDCCPGCGSTVPSVRLAILFVECRDAWHDAALHNDALAPGWGPPARAATPIVLESGPVVTPRAPVLTIYAVYRNPTDYPGRYVLRAWRIDHDGALQAELEPRWTGTELEEIRRQIPQGRVRLEPWVGDDPAICEVWV